MSVIPPPTSSPAITPRVGFGWALGLLVVALAGYTNALRAPFLFDDGASIRENATIQDLANLSRVLSPPHNGSGVTGRPIVNLSLAINYAIGGLSAWGYHATNVALHLAAGLVLFGLVRRTLCLPRFQRRFGASATLLGFAAAALWLAHPLQTESVTCVIQRTEVLFGLFYLLTLYAFVRFVETGSRAWRITAIGACLLGMSSKEVMVSAPLMVLLFDRTFVAGTFASAWRQRRGLYLALGATWLLLGSLVIGNGGTRGDAAGLGLGVTGWSYALKQCDAIVWYVRLVAWPHPLVLFYGSDVVETLGAVWWQFILVATAATATLLAVWRRPLAGFIGFWFFTILAPSSSIIPLVTQTMAEHRMYLPLAAPLTAVVLGFHALGGRRALVPLVILALTFVVLTAQRNSDYRSAISIWSDTVAKRPGVVQARVNLGEALQAAGRDVEALQQYRAANPLPLEGLNNVATLLIKSGRIPEAIAVCEDALARKPDFAIAHNNLGSALWRAGQSAESERHIRTALRLQPSLAPAHSNLAGVFVREKRYAEAIAEAETALKLKPDLVDAEANLVQALFATGRVADALPHLEAAVRLDPHNAELWSNLGAVLYQLGRTREAVAPLRQALVLNPDFINAHNNLGSALVQLDEPSEAVTHFRAALRLDPHNADTHSNLGIALGRLGQTEEAAVEFATALKINPSHVAARANLAALASAGSGNSAPRKP